MCVLHRPALLHKFCRENTDFFRVFHATKKNSENTSQLHGRKRFHCQAQPFLHRQPEPQWRMNIRAFVVVLPLARIEYRYTPDFSAAAFQTTACFPSG
jgi:hypothetical protein